MNRYILIHRLTGPAILLLIGVLALLHQADIISSFWHLFWPLLLILIGVIKLAERAALAGEGYPQVPGATYAGYGDQSYQGAVNQPAPTSTSIVPVERNGNDGNGGGL